jgi:1-aminocyclopropane-1-carboxylate deaminase/D-cysteine desulfhydrase-like pyridoxal-dependent ACC family enzyme
VLYGDPPQEVQGNYLLDQILGAEMVFTGSPDRTELDARILAEAERLRTLGFRPYVISRGGASPLGCLGYVVAALELAAQLQQLQIKPDYVILATGSCGTQAGLLVGSKCLKLDYCLWGMTVSRPRQECIERIENLSAAAAELLELDCTVETEDVMVNDDYIGDGYGEVTQEDIEAIQWVARTEGIFLDPVYTGKAMAGLIGLIRQGKIGPNDTVVFLHTGGSPALFAHASRFLINSADQTPK